MFDKPVDITKKYGTKQINKGSRPEASPKLTPHPFDTPKRAASKDAMPAAMNHAVQAAPGDAQTAEQVEEPETQYDKDRREAVEQAVAEGRTLSERKSWEAAAAMSRRRIAEKYKAGRR